GSTLAARTAALRAFRDGYRALQAADPGRLAPVERGVRRYGRLLGAARIRDRHVAATYPPGRVLAFAARSLLAIAVWIPVAAAGVLQNWIPYRLCDVLSRRP